MYRVSTLIKKKKTKPTKIKDIKGKRTIAQPLNENTTKTGREPMQCSAYYNKVSKKWSKPRMKKRVYTGKIHV